MIKKLLLILFIILIAVGIGGYFYLTNANQYQTDGTLQLEGLKGEVKIIRDEKNMPYIYAENRHDVLFGQGFAMAQDRLFQMQLNRMFAEGRIAELAGASALQLDIRHRTIGFARAAQKHVQLLHEKEQQDLAAFVAGVNAFIDRRESIHLEFSLAGIQPDHWDLATPVAIIYYMGWSSSANMEAELTLQQLYQYLGKEKFTSLIPIHTNPDDTAKSKELDTEFMDMLAHASSDFSTNLTQAWLKDTPRQLAWGSNNWVSGASRSSNGMPIMAGDPHLDSRILPGTMYACGLFTPEFRAVGVTIPGMFGLLIGRNEHLTNSITNAYLDVQDLYLMDIHPDDTMQYLMGDQTYDFDAIEETIKIKSNDGWEEKKITVRQSKRGVVVNDLFPQITNDKALVLRWAALENMGPSLGISHLMDAKTVDEANAILANSTMGCNNITLADTEGNILWRTIGSLPKRTPGSGRMPFVVQDTTDNWLGFVAADSMPMEKNPDKGWLGNANNKTIKSSYPHYVSNYYSPYYRYERLVDLMSSKEKFTPQDHWQYQRDIYNTLAEKLAPIMAEALQKQESTQDMAEYISQWDFMETKESVATTIFQNTYRHFAYEVFVDELGEDLAMVYLKNYYVWQERFEQMYLKGSSDWFDDQRTNDTKEGMTEILQRAALKAKAELTEKFGSDMAQWQWGKNHQIEFVNPLFREGTLKPYFSRKFPMAGSGETLYRARYGYDKPEAIEFAACLRMVADLADDDKVIAVIAGGIVGRTFHEGMGDQLDALMNGESLYWWFSDQEIRKHQKSVLVLKN